LKLRKLFANAFAAFTTNILVDHLLLFQSLVSRCQTLVLRHGRFH